MEKQKGIKIPKYSEAPTMKTEVKKRTYTGARNKNERQREEQATKQREITRKEEEKLRPTKSITARTKDPKFKKQFNELSTMRDAQGNKWTDIPGVKYKLNEEDAKQLNLIKRIKRNPTIMEQDKKAKIQHITRNRLHIKDKPETMQEEVARANFEHWFDPLEHRSYQGGQWG